jgi:uncharacterized protein YqgV (UPF0045/DUF77 family)
MQEADRPTSPSEEHRSVRAEFLIEPFVEGSPGPHVKAALEACRAAGFEPEVGAFATTIDGSFDAVSVAVDRLLRAAYENGASAVQVRIGEPAAASRFGNLHDALERMVGAVEDEFGSPLADLSRVDKQAAVRLLDERGAFLLRKAVEAVGEMMGVSRITIYNYLNAIDRSAIDRAAE